MNITKHIYDTTYFNNINTPLYLLYDEVVCDEIVYDVYYNCLFCGFVPYRNWNFWLVMA